MDKEKKNQTSLETVKLENKEAVRRSKKQNRDDYMDNIKNFIMQ